MGFDKDGVTAWRAAVDADAGDLGTLVDGLLESGHSLRAPDLKRVPAPYERDHPRADLLQRKGFVIWRELPDSPDEAALWDAAQPVLAVPRWITTEI